MIHVWLKNSVLATGLFLPLMTYAESGDVLETVLVTGAYSPVPLSDLTNTVTVLDNEFLQATNKRTVADALRTVPGVLVEQQGGAGGLTAVSIRGGEANFTLVLVNGVQLNDPTNTRGGSFDFGNLNIANVERIEIVRGPQSALYGSDALAGVINIITRGAALEHRQQLTTAWGEHDYRQYYFNATGKAETLGYALQVSRSESGEAVEGSERNNDEYNLGIDWSPSTNHQFKAQFRYLDGERASFPEQSGGPELAIGRELDGSDYTDKILDFNWGWQVFSNWRSELRANRLDLDEDYSSPGISPFLEVPPQETKTEFTRDKLQWVNSFNFKDDYRIDVGIDYRDESGDSKGSLDFGFITLPTDFSLDWDTTGVFMGVQARPLPPLMLQASIRHDDPDGFKAETTTNLGTKYDLTNQISLRANWGEAFKLPSFFALGHGLVGNPDLQPETGESWDLGVEWRPLDVLKIDVNYFSNDYKNLIDFDSESFTNVNRNEVETSGAELQINWAPNATIQFIVHGTYTDIDVKETAAPLTGRPQSKAGAIALWEIKPDWHAAVDYQWTDSQYAGSRHTGDSVIESLGDFQRVDITMKWQAAGFLALELAIDNLLDESYHTAVGFQGLDRSIRASISLTH